MGDNGPALEGSGVLGLQKARLLLEAMGGKQLSAKGFDNALRYVSDMIRDLKLLAAVF